MSRPGRAAAALAAALLAVLAGCGGGEHGEATEEVASPLAGCDALTAPPPEAPPDPAAEPGEPEMPLPELTLSCFTGQEPVQVAALRGPAVVNFWASWCAPCREELPVLQRYADRAAGTVHVVGVVTEDTRPRAAALAEDLQLTFPALDDPERELFNGLGVYGMPGTVFVDAHGVVQHRHVGPPFDDRELSELVSEHLGVGSEDIGPDPSAGPGTPAESGG